jgi:hypothetical protein
MIEMVMPRNLQVWGDKGIRGIEFRGRPDRSSIASLGYAIKACPVPMQSMSAIGGFDGRD